MNRFLIALLTICKVYAGGLSQTSSSDIVNPNPRSSSEINERTQQKSSPIADFIIGSEDVLFINVWHEPDFTVTVKVRNDGKISYPLLDDIQASGLTTDELQKEITAGLDKFVNEPQVTVIVQEIHSKVVNVIGSVGRPGVYDIRGPLTVIELIART